ncbi:MULTISPECIES: nucleoside recognition domain-containing protein [Paenibacillus]|jgi:spore maturation protein A|uniref:Nucleoside recognition protein n=2 Tax=Paenibacillus TaxID=44249 RepID=A0ABX2Z816_PAEPO|nr:MULTISPECIES: nucleoside recognition domain-containing protein [Paenibacillus]APQ60047.1 nucleoside recognition protein [Paenibacillus polymyxa]MDR6776513.1 spore maturation protein A [Paenibacillus peoriae]ODA07082.1 nucleoside recognition protein [Paenibacillus polymyxa]OME72749.1 nucleoside recognition protein [Paenibacillus peoriae]VUG05913.1 Spore maturation protein A [Paenibacillus polymyxa]
MIHLIWVALICIGFVFAAAQGNIEVVTKAAFDGATTGVTVCFGLISVLVFWMGMMRLAEDGGLLQKISKLLSPLVAFLFPDVPRNHPAMGYILSNMSANLLGLGNAATPMGIKAMQELQTLNPDKQTATPAMCTLLALNTASITLIPTTLIAIRLNFHSAHPAEIVGTTLVATAIATFAAIAADRWYRSRELRRRPPAIPPSQTSLAPLTSPASTSAASSTTSSVSSPAVPRTGITAAKGRDTTWKG